MPIPLAEDRDLAAHRDRVATQRPDLTLGRLGRHRHQQAVRPVAAPEALRRRARDLRHQLGQGREVGAKEARQGDALLELDLARSRPQGPVLVGDRG